MPRWTICLPDFADLSQPDESYPLLHTLRERAAGRKIVSLTGSIGTRKGIDLLLSVIPTLPADEYFFLMAGKSWLTEEQTRRVKAFEAAHANCLFVLERIPDEACFNALIAASDVVFAAYRHFSGSSNLLTKAAAFGRPIVVSSGQCMGRGVEHYGTGIAIAEDDTQACREAIVRLCRDGVPRPEGPAAYTAQHSLQRLVPILKSYT